MRAFFLLLLLSSTAQAKIFITVKDATVKKSNLALGRLHSLSGSSVASPNFIKMMERQIRSDLSLTNLFEFLKTSDYAQYDTRNNLYRMNYDSWALTGAAFALKLAYRITGSKLTLEAFLYDIPGRTKIFSNRYQHSKNSYYKVVHAMAEDISSALTGERGLFSSRILMVCRNLKKKGKRIPKEIYVADPDGRNLRQLTFDRTLSLSPAWAPNGRFISYTQYSVRTRVKRGKRLRETVPVLKTHYLDTGRRAIISERKGMNSGAAWSPAGDKIAVTLSYSGRPEIYLLRPNGKGKPVPLSRSIKLRRISGIGFQPNYPSLLFDVEPSWSPDGSKLVFSSARTGKPMIYVVNTKSKLATQLTFAGRYNSSPDWSPKGDKILFAAQHHAKGNFDIYVIDPDGNNLARLTSGGRLGARKINYENASWAPTGRHFTYSSNESGRYQVFIRTLDGYVKRAITPPHLECTTPDWGPFEG